MKKYVVVVLLMIIMVTLAGCYSYNEVYNEVYEDVYEEAYDDGYLDGYVEGESSNDAYSAGYSDGYFDAECDFSDMDDYFMTIEQESVNNSIDFGGWHPEEAWGIIESYENNDSSFFGDRVPTKSEYREAIQSLIGFYEYFYTHEHIDLYEGYYAP